MTGAVGTNYVIVGGAQALCGTDTTTTVDSQNGSVLAGTQTAHSDSVTTSVDGAYLLDTLVVTTSPTLAAGQSSLWNSSATTTFTTFGVGSAVGVVSPPAAKTMSWTYASTSTSTSNATAHSMVAIRPAGAITPAPVLISLNPTSGVQGSTVALTINGTGLTGGTAAITGTGVPLTNNVVVNDTKLTVTITIAANAGLGTDSVTVTTSAGTSNALNFAVLKSGAGVGSCGVPVTGATSVPIHYARLGETGYDGSQMGPPGPGQSYVDPYTGCGILQVATKNACRNEYANYSTINATDTYQVCLQLTGGKYYIYDLLGHLIANDAATGNTLRQFRWSTTNGNWFYTVAGKRVLKKDISACTAASPCVGSGVVTTVLHTFPSYIFLYIGCGEGDISADGDHLAFVGAISGFCGGGAGTNLDLFLYTISTDTVGTIKNIGAAPFNNIKVTPNNEILVGWTDPACPANEVSESKSGTEMYTANWTFLRCEGWGGHQDVGYDLSGNEIAVRIDGNAATCAHGGGVELIQLSNSAKTCVFDLAGLEANYVHVALHNFTVLANGKHSPWIIASYSDGRPSGTDGYPLASNWKSQWSGRWGEIVAVAVDGSSAVSLAQHRTRVGDNTCPGFAPNPCYWKVPFASPSRDGSLVSFGSDMGQAFGIRNSTGPYPYVVLFSSATTTSSLFTISPASGNQGTAVNVTLTGVGLSASSPIPRRPQ